MDVCEVRVSAEPGHARRYVASLVISTVAQLAVSVGSFVVTPVFIDGIGADGFGQWVICLQLLTYVSLIDLGVSSALFRQLGAAVGRGDDPRPLVEHASALMVAQLPVVALVVVAAAHWAPSAATRPVLILGVTVACTYPLRPLREALRGAMDLPFLAAIQLVSSLVMFSVQTLLVLRGWGLEGLAVGWVCAELVVWVGVIFRIVRRFHSLLPGRLRWASLDLREAGWLALIQVTQFLTVGTDVLLVRAVTSSAEVAQFAVTLKLQSALAMYPQQIVLTAVPVLVAIAGSSGVAAVVARARTVMQVAMLFSAFVGAVALSANSRFVEAWVGVEMDLGLGVVALVAALGFVRVMRLVVASVLFAEGQQRVVSVVGVFVALVNVGVAYALGLRWGAVGVVAGYLLGVLLLETPLLVWVARSRCDEVTGLIRSFITQATMVVIGGGAAVLLADACAPRGWMGVGVAASIGVAVMAAVHSPLVRSQHFRDEVFGRLRRVIARVSK